VSPATKDLFALRAQNSAFKHFAWKDKKGLRNNLVI
jgi:hypothetical protein